MIDQLRKVDELTNAMKSWRFGLELAEKIHLSSLHLVINESPNASPLNEVNESFSQQLTAFSNCWEAWRAAVTVEVIRELRIASEDNRSELNEVVAFEYMRLEDPYHNRAIALNTSLRVDDCWVAIVGSIEQDMDSTIAGDVELAKQIRDVITGFERTPRPSGEDNWERAEREIASAIRRLEDRQPIGNDQPATSQSTGAEESKPATQGGVADNESDRKMKGLKHWNEGNTWPEVAELLDGNRDYANSVKQEIKRYAKDNELNIRAGKPGAPKK